MITYYGCWLTGTGKLGPWSYAVSMRLASAAGIDKRDAHHPMARLFEEEKSRATKRAA